MVAWRFLQEPPPFRAGEFQQHQDTENKWFDGHFVLLLLAHQGQIQLDFQGTLAQSGAHALQAGDAIGAFDRICRVHR